MIYSSDMGIHQIDSYAKNNKTREARRRFVRFLSITIAVLIIILISIHLETLLGLLPRYGPDIHHSLPDAQKYVSQKSNICPQLTRPENITYRNGAWQVIQEDSYEMSIFNAYFDNRTSVSDSAIIRVFAVASHPADTPIICQVWYPDTDNPVPIKAHTKDIGRGAKVNNTEFMEYLYSCEVPTALIIPTHVSIATKQCYQSTTFLPILFPNETGQVLEFGICVPVTYWFMNPFRVIEWVELNKILGVQEMNIYNSSIYFPGLTVFLHYYATGDITLNHAPPPVDENNLQSIKLSVLAALNDCMYRNMYRYKYIITIDVDEVIIPRTVNNMSALISQIEASIGMGSQLPAFMFRNAYFWTNYQPRQKSPHYSNILRYLTRTEVSPITTASKSIVDPKQCVVLTNHYCSIRTPTVGDYWSVSVDEKFGLNQHYKKCHFNKKECEESLQTEIFDPTAHKYREKLANRMSEVLATIDLS